MGVQEYKSVFQNLQPLWQGTQNPARGAVNSGIHFFFIPEPPFFIFILFDLILYVPSTIFQLCRDGSFWVEPVLS